MSVPAPIVLSTPADLIAALPHMLGFQPEESVVAVALHGVRPGMTMRVDLPAEVEDMLTAVVPPLLRDRPDAVILVGYESASGGAGAVVSALSAAMGAGGVEVRDRIVVTPTGWRHLRCSCCPPEGNPLPPAHHPAAVEMMVRTGSNPAADRATMGARLGVGARGVPVGRECDRIAGTGTGMGTVEAGAVAWGRVLSSHTPVAALPDRVLAVAALAVRGNQRIQFRDVLLSHLCTNNDLLDQLDPTIVQAVQASIPLPTTPEEVERALDRLTDACAAIPDQYAVPTLVVLAMYSWWHGNGTLARFAVDRALAVDPRYQLALLVERMLNLGIRPPR